MNEVIKNLRERAKANLKRIVFPESSDERVQEAVSYLKNEGIVEPLLLTKGTMEPEKQEEFASNFFERKKAKGVSFEEARQIMENPLYYAAMLVRFGYMDGFVAGAAIATSSVIKTALNCLEIDKKRRTVSSCFVMAVPDCQYGENGIFVYADCGVIPYPTGEQLANISISAADFAKDVLGITPYVALLSFSTKGSAAGRHVNRIREAVEIAKSKNSGFLIDGELQADSALVPEVAARKLDKSEVAGRANVLIFPNLDAGNICYKLIQRLAKARAIGPIVLGTVQPCSDLSRGCSVEDIIDCAVITAIRAQKRKI